MSDLSYLFRLPTKIVYGAGSVAEMEAEVSELGCRRAMIVTDGFLAAQTDIVDRVRKALGSACAGVFADVQPDSRVEIVDAGAARTAELGADCLVSVGGGSSIDTAKAVSIVMGAGGSMRDHFAVHAIAGPLVPHVAVPTTAGTGSEVTNVALVKDESARAKHIVLDNHIFPSTAVLDPGLTTGMPPALTAATAMDAMTHAVEAVTSVFRNPVSEALAAGAITLIDASILKALEEPGDLDARGSLLHAATMAGAAFCNAMVGLVHAVAHALGGVCSVHHGLANSIMLPHVIRFNAETDAELYLPVARALGMLPPVPADAAAGGSAATEAALAVADHLGNLARSAGIHTHLARAGVDRSRFADIADKAISDGAVINNCRPVTGTDEVIALLEAAW